MAKEGSSGIEPLLSQATAERRSIMELLTKREWFQRTSLDLQRSLVMLPDGSESSKAANFNGFLRDLSARPDVIGGVRVMRLIDLPRGRFAVVPVFEVENAQGETFSYEYVSWRHGPASGAKCLVFLAESGTITHFVALEGEKFATGQVECDCPGGFVLDNPPPPATEERRPQPALSATLQREILEELGLSDAHLVAARRLGSVRTDPGMTNNCVELSALVFDLGGNGYSLRGAAAASGHELTQASVVRPVDEFLEFVQRCEHALFKAAAACLLAEVVGRGVSLRDGLTHALLSSDYRLT